MEQNARLINKSYMSYLPTTLPVYYYGMPNGEIVLVYARHYTKKFNVTGLEFVFAVQEDFTYDFESDKILNRRYNGISKKEFAEVTNCPNPRIKINKVYRNLNSYAEARLFLIHKRYELAGKKAKNNTDPLELVT